MATRLAATVLAVGLVALVVATIVGISAGQTLARSIVEDRVTSLQASGSWDARAQLNYYGGIAEQMAISPQTARVIQEFSTTFDALPDTLDEQLLDEQQRLLEQYEGAFLEPIAASGEDVGIGDILTDDPAAVYLQAAYSLGEGSVADPSTVSDAGDGSEWTQVHAAVHDTYLDALRRAGLHDIYLVDRRDRFVYTVSKGPELGTSLSVGAFSGSVVDLAAQAAASADDGAVVTDLSFYNGAPGITVGAAAAQVSGDDGPIGTVILTYDGAVFTERMASLVEVSGGVESTGDLYLVGADRTTRSDPPAFVTDPAAFLDAAAAAGQLTEETRAEIERRGTTVLTLPITDATFNAAIDGETDVARRGSITGEEVVGSVERVPTADVRWFTTSEIRVAATDAAVASFRQILLVGTSVFLVALAFVAVSWANRFMSPVRAISDRLAQVSTGPTTAAAPESLRIRDTSPVEFHRLLGAFVAMGAALRRQAHELRDARAQRLDVLHRMLPDSVAQRVARGDVESLDEVPSATVVVVVVLGLGSLTGPDVRGGRNRRLLDELHAELDAIALEKGLDRIKVVGDSYFAVCGHDRPYLDHAPRVVAFAERAGEAVAGLAQDSSQPLATATGIATGPVTVGMSGGARLVFDVWGPTVTVAHDLARRAGAGETLLTEATRVRLPKDLHLRPRQLDDSSHASEPAEDQPPVWSLTVDTDAVAGTTEGRR